MVLVARAIATRVGRAVYHAVTASDTLSELEYDIMEVGGEASATLAIEHVEGSIPATFKLTRLSNGKSLMPVPVVSPYEVPVIASKADSGLMRELRWYLEDFLDYPFHPETLHADRVLPALKVWGTQAFNALFDRRDAGEWLSDSGLVQIRSDDPHGASTILEFFAGLPGTVSVTRTRLFCQPLSAPCPVKRLYDQLVDVLQRVGSEPVEGTVESVVLKAGEIHSFKAVGDSPLVQVDVNLSPRFIQENL